MHQSDETAGLRTSVARGEAQYRTASGARDALERDLTLIKATVAKQASALVTAKSESAASQQEAVARSKDARQSEMLADAARSEATSADERCSATSSALAAVSSELETLRAEFDVERKANSEVRVPQPSFLFF